MPPPHPSPALAICDFLPTPSWRERGRPGSCLGGGGGGRDVPSCPRPPLGSPGTGPGWQLQSRHARVAATGASRGLPLLRVPQRPALPAWTRAPLGSSGTSWARLADVHMGTCAGTSAGVGGDSRKNSHIFVSFCITC